MAKLSAHGAELGTIYSLTSARRYMSDGVILENKGFGWKLGPKLKAGIDIRDAYGRAVERARVYELERPAYAALKKALFAACGLCKRWKLYAAISLMPDDADGVWSEVSDGYGDNLDLDVDEIAGLCAAYRLAKAEGDAMRIKVAA